MDIRRSGMKIVNETPSQRLSLLQHVEARHEQFRDLEDDDSLGLFLLSCSFVIVDVLIRLCALAMSRLGLKNRQLLGSLLV